MATATELNVNQTVDASQIADTIFGDGITIVSSSLTGNAVQSGIYSGADTTMPGVAPSDSGVIFSTGNTGTITNSSGTTNTNTQADAGTNLNGGGDADLTALGGNTTFDAVLFEATFIPTGDFLTMQFTFSSEEYLEYVNGGVNDVFGVWVNGVNIALTPDDQTVSIDTVNNVANSNLYVDNPADSDPFNTEMDGFTITLTMTAPLIAGAENTIKIGLADGGDGIYDSNVMIAADSVQVVALAMNDTVELGINSSRVVDLLANDIDANSTGLTITEINGQAISVGQTITLATGEQITLNSDGTVTVTSDGDVTSSSLTYSIVDGNGVTDVGYLTINTVNTPAPDGIVEGTAGNDVIDAAYTGDPNGDDIDANDALLPGEIGNDDIIYGFAGNDTINAGDGNDEVFGGADNDTINSGLGNDTAFGGDGTDSIFGQSGDDALFGGEGNDYVDGGDGNDSLSGDAGDDTLVGGTGDDIIDGQSGDDTIVLEDSFGDDAITGGETGEVNGDTLDASAVTTGLTVDLQTLQAGNPEMGTISDGTFTASFQEIENLILTDQDDTVTGSSGGENIDLGAGDDTIALNGGADTVFGGTGNDVFTVSDGFDGANITGGDDYDTLDLSGLSNPVTVVFSGPGAGTVTDDVTGDVLTFSEIEFLITTNQADTVDATLDDGYTYVNTLAGADTYTGSDGDDVVDDEIGIPDGAGDDTFFGGGGNDEIWAGDDNDALFGGTGNDTLQGQAGDDIIDGGLGDDIMYGGTGDDVFAIGDNHGNDTVVGGENTGDNDILDLYENGSGQGATITYNGDESGIYDFDGTASGGTFSEIETLDATNADDIVDASADTGGVTVFGNQGDDSITGGSGADSLLGGDGADTISGGTGADTISGGTGDDTIIFAVGDTATGGSGNDLFVLEDLGEPTNGIITVVGGQGGETADDGNPLTLEGDTLQLGTLADLSTLVQNSDGINADGNETFSGSVTLDDGTILNFSEIENIICFTPGTRIATAQGLVAIEDLEVGDMVVTRDHGLQPVRWIERRMVPAVDRFAPVRIRKGVLAGQEHDLIVSPQHRVLFQGYRAELLFGESEVLASAKHLVDGMDVTQDEGSYVTYIHMLFDQHEIIFAEGAATESFHPGDIGFDAVGDEAREELFAIFPELRSDLGSYGATARRCLKAHEAKLILS